MKNRLFHAPAFALACACTAVLLAHPAGHAQAPAPAPQEFAWRASLDVPAGAPMARISLPADALSRLQSADARDVRIFNGAGTAVPFAFMAQPAQATPPPLYTRAYAALPLYSASDRGASTIAPNKGALQVRIDDAGPQRSVWVQVDGAAPAASAATRLQSVILDTRQEKQLLSALQVRATLPPNAPVRVAVSTSADLASWTTSPVRGRLYRFDGDGAPANDTLDFDRPLRLQDRYLRLDWAGQDGVAVSAVTGVVAPALQPADRVRADLPAPTAQGKDTVEFALPFATPIAALLLSTTQNNALLPVRLLGRSELSQPWRLLGQAVIYRLGADSVNPPQRLSGASVRWLRVVSTHGADLASAQLRGSAEFEPVQIAFVATGEGPFQLAAGRADTAPAGLPLGVLAGPLGTRKVEELPQARLGAVSVQSPATPGPLARLIPTGVSDKAVLLWSVLVLGVLLLGAVAWSLLRQLKTQAPRDSGDRAAGSGRLNDSEAR